MVMRLRAGLNRPNACLYRKVKLTPSPACNCGLEDQTAERILQRWPLLQTTRQNVWPRAVQLHTKLDGSKQELETHSLCRPDSQCSGYREEEEGFTCVFSCNLPAMLVAKWPRLFTWHCGNTRVKRVRNQSAHTLTGCVFFVRLYCLSLMKRVF